MISARFLKKSPLQTGLIIAGISIGLGILIFIGSLVTSLQAFLIEQTLGNSAQVVIAAKKRGDPVRFNRRLQETLSEDRRIKAVFPQRTISVVYEKDSETAPLTIKGGNSEAMDSIYELSDKIVEGRFFLDDESIIIGREFADEFALEPGDDMNLTLSDRSQAELEVTGIFSLGEEGADEALAFTNGELPADNLVFLAGQYSSIELQVNDVFDSSAVAARLRERFPGLDISDWQVEQKNLVSALNSQTISTSIIQVFVLVAVSLGIASTLSISAIQKTRQIGILKAVGLTDRQAAAIFLWQGVILGLLGAVGGNLVGRGLIKLFQSVTARLDSSLFPISVNPDFVLIATITGVAVALLSAVIPSRRTAGLDPIRVIQDS